MSITRIYEIGAAEGKAEELYDFLKSLVPHITSSDGCSSCEVLRNNDDRDNFVFIEKWESIEHHKKSAENFPKEKLKSAKHLFGKPPKSSYYSV